MTTQHEQAESSLPKVLKGHAFLSFKAVVEVPIYDGAAAVVSATVAATAAAAPDAMFCCKATAEAVAASADAMGIGVF